MKIKLDIKTIQIARLQHGYSQRKLAKKIGVSFVTINQMETGKTIPNPENLKKICTELDLRMEDICNIG